MRLIPSARRILGAVALMAGMAVLASGCASPQSAAPSTAPQQGGTISFAVDVDPVGHLDVHSSQLDINAILMRPVFDSLVAQNPDGSIVPWLASSWSISDDGLSYTFVLRDDVTFTDGAPFNAEAVKANFDHIVAPETASAQASSMLGGDFYAGTTVIDDNTVRVSFTQPFAPFLANAAAVQLGFYSPLVLAANADQLKAGGPGISVGTGPFVLSSYTPGSELVFTKNPAYNWSPEGAAHQGAAIIDTLDVKVLPENAVRTGALTSGQVDIIGDTAPASIAQLGTGYNIISTQSPGVPYSLFLNVTRPVFANVAERLALAEGFDLNAAVNGVFQGRYQRAWSILSPGTPNSYDASLEGSRPFDSGDAKALLDAQGWTGRDAEGFRTKDGQRLSARWISYTPVSDDNASLAALIQDGMKNVGFEIVHDVLEPGAYLDAYLAGDYDLTDWGYLSADADILRSHLGTNGFQNASHLSDATVDAKLAAAVATTDPARRETLYKELQQYNADAIATLPLYVPEYVLASDNGIGGVTVDIHGWPQFTAAYTSR